MSGERKKQEILRLETDIEQAMQSAEQADRQEEGKEKYSKQEGYCMRKIHSAHIPKKATIYIREKSVQKQKKRLREQKATQY